MTEAIFGLVGVVIGGLLQGSWSWVMERRREGWAARKGGRLFGPHLHRCPAADHALAHATTWAELAVVIENNLEPWPEHAEVFAGTLDWEQWFDIYAAVRAWQQFTWEVPDNAEKRLIMPGTDDETYIRNLIDQTMKGAVACAAVGISGVRPRRLRSAIQGMWYRIRPPDEDKLIDQVLTEQFDLPPEDSSGR